MTTYDDYFTHDDKPFAENINDALLLSNVFDLTVPVEVPRMFRDSTWANSTSQRKCSVAIVTLKESLPSGVSISTVDGKSVLTGTGTVKLGFYPNFNAFGKYKSISWTSTGSVTVNLKTVGGSTIASNIANGTITSESSELRKLQEIVIEIVLSSATLKTLSVVMENKSSERYGAEVGIDDVNGLDDTLTALNTRVSSLESTDSSICNYDLGLVNNYENSPNVPLGGSTAIVCTVTDIYGDPVNAKSVTLYKNGTSVGTETTGSNGKANFVLGSSVFSETGTFDFQCGNSHIFINVLGYKSIKTYATDFYVLSINKGTRTAKLTHKSTNHNVAVGDAYVQTDFVPSDYRPATIMRTSVRADGGVILYVDGSGKVALNNSTGASVSLSSSATLYWDY